VNNEAIRGKELQGLRRSGNILGRKLDLTPAQALTQNPQHADFIALHGDGRTVESDEVFDQLAAAEFSMKPIRPLRKHGQSEAHC
jgi:hypothetical protein